jgi:hypothetical protein
MISIKTLNEFGRVTRACDMHLRRYACNGEGHR